MAKRIFFLIERIALLSTQQGGYASKQEMVASLAIASMQAFNAMIPAKAQRAMGPGLNRALDTRLAAFIRRQAYTSSTPVLPVLPITAGVFTLPDACQYVDYYLYKTTVDATPAATVEEVSGAALAYRITDPNCSPTAKYPIVGQLTGHARQLYPATGLLTVQFYVAPTEPVYFESYTTGSAVYDDSQSVDMGWGLEMEPELIVRTLRLLGLEIRDPQLSAVAAQLTAESL